MGRPVSLTSWHSAEADDARGRCDESVLMPSVFV
jgi:hypothetical protein